MRVRPCAVAPPTSSSEEARAGAPRKGVELIASPSHSAQQQRQLTFALAIPPGALRSTTLQAIAPNGAATQVVVPHGVAEGAVLTIAYTV